MTEDAVSPRSVNHRQQPLSRPSHRQIHLLVDVSSAVTYVHRRLPASRSPGKTIVHDRGTSRFQTELSIIHLIHVSRSLHSKNRLTGIHDTKHTGDYPDPESHRHMDHSVEAFKGLQRAVLHCCRSQQMSGNSNRLSLRRTSAISASRFREDESGPKRTIETQRHKTHRRKKHTAIVPGRSYLMLRGWGARAETRRERSRVANQNIYFIWRGGNGRICSRGSVRVRSFLFLRFPPTRRKEGTTRD